MDHHLCFCVLISEISVGALVAVKCQTASKSKSGSAQATTDEYGEFVIDLPSHLHGVPDLQKACEVKVLQIPKNSKCRPAFVKKHKGLKFSSIGNGIRTYTSGKIRFQHITSKPLKTCIRRAGASSVKQTSSMVE
ncbi:Pollen Ole e 1 allergen/extensin [Corchorus capsularis]|uniref:Pollen Ole e 1 allergen/extensin n=1 Tax=Corchorus capsularis TaxID=210143 RepID=A0A1R3I305_COCAP|nr:Pollen Ole e 1 allergen/extensin [Corchorus capsularis]